MWDPDEAQEAVKAIVKGATWGEGAEPEGMYVFKMYKEKLATGTGEDQLAGQEENRKTVLQEGGAG